MITAGTNVIARDLQTLEVEKQQEAQKIAAAKENSEKAAKEKADAIIIIHKLFGPRISLKKYLEDNPEKKQEAKRTARADKAEYEAYAAKHPVYTPKCTKNNPSKALNRAARRAQGFSYYVGFNATGNKFDTVLD